MIKASAQEDALAPAKPCKVPVTVQDLVLLADALAGDSPRDQAIFDTALVAFWSLWLTLITLSNYLCPVEAILRLLARCAAGGDALFGYSTFNQSQPRTCYSGRDEIGERFTAVPTRGPSSEDFDSDGVGDPATAPEGTHLAIPRNRLQMAEHEDWSEGNSSEAETSEPRPAGSSIGHFAAELSSPLEATDDNGPVQRHDATTVSYAGPEETPTSGLEPSISRSIGRDDIAEPENRRSISLHPNPLTEVVAPIAEASDDAPFQGSTTPDLTGRNKVPLEGLMSPTADASSALLESKAATDESESDVANDEEAPEVDPTDLVEPLVARQLDSTSKKQDPVFDKPYVASREEEPEVLPAHAVEQPVVQEREELAPTSDAELDPVFDESYVSNSEEEPEFLPDHAVQRPVVEDRDSNSDAIFDSAGHTQDTEAGIQYYPEPATATITDANSAESEGTVEAEPLPRDTGVVHNLRPISPETEGSSDGEQSASLLTETAAGPSHEHTGLAKAVAAFQVANEAEPVLARSAPFSNEGEVDIPTAAHSDSTETGASSIPANLSPDRQASDDGSVNDVQDNACAADAGPETTLISEFLANPTPHTHASESSSSEDDLDVSHTLDASLIHPSNAMELPMSASDAHLFDLQPSRAVRSDVQIQAASPSENDLAVDSEQLPESVLTEPAANDVERDSDAGRIPPELQTDEILGDAASGAEERHAATSNQSDQFSSFAAPPILPVDTTHPEEWHTEDDERYTQEDERHTEGDERHTEKDERHTEKDERHTEEDERHTEDATPTPVPTSWVTYPDRDESVEGSDAVTGTGSSGQGYESNVVVAPVPVPRKSSSGTPSNQPQMAEKKGLEEEGRFGLPQGETSNVDLAATSPFETPTGLSHELEAVNQDTDNQPHDTPHASGITPKELTSSEPEPAPSLTTKSADAVQRKVEESFSLEAIPQAEDAVPIAKTFGDSLVQVPPTQESPAQDARPLEELVDLTAGSSSAQLEEMFMTDPSLSEDATREQEPEVPSTEPIEQIVAREVVSTPDEIHEPVVDTQERTAEPQETAEAATYSILDANPAQADAPIEVEMLPTATDIMQNIDVDMRAGYSSSNEQLISVSTETAAGPSIQDPEVIETVSESHGTNEKGHVEPSLVSDEVTDKVDHPATVHKDENSNEYAATDFQEPSSSLPEEPHASSDMAVDIQQGETDSQASTVQTPEMPQDRSPAPSETEGNVGESVAVSDDSATEPDSSPAVISEVTPAVDIHASAEVGPVSHEDSLARKQPQATADETAADSTDVQTVPDKTREPSIDASSAGSATEDINPALVNAAVNNELVVAPIDEAPVTEEPAPTGAHVISEPELQSEETHLPKNELALDAEQLTEPLVTGEPTPEDTNRVDDSASESQEVHTDELPREAASGLEQHTTTPSQSEVLSSVAATPTTPVDTAHSDQRQAEAETPGPKTPTLGSHSDRDENAEQSAVVPEKLSSPEDSESDVLDEFATGPESASHAAPHNQPQMGEKEKPSEGTSLSSAPSKDENLNVVPIDASANQLPPDSSPEPESQVDDVIHPSAGTDVAGTTPLESNQPSESMVPLVETPDHLVQDSATEDHIAQNAAPPAEAVDSTVDSGSTQLEKTAITESSTSDVASGEKAPEVPLPDPPEQLVAQERAVISDVNPDTAADTEDAKGEPQDTLEMVTVTAVDENPAQTEGTIDAELLPTDSDAATKPAINSQEPEGSSDTEQPVSVPNETAADSSTEDSAIEKAAVPQVINENESVDASTVPANEGTADQSNEAAEAAVADSGEPTQPTTETSDSPESHVDKTEGENTSTDSTDKPNASSAIDSPTIPAIDVEATTAAADESGKPAEDPAMEPRELGEVNPPATAEESEKAIEGAAIQSEEPPPPPLDVKEDSSKPVADIQQTEPESLVTSEQTPDSAQDPNPGQPEGQGNAADGMEASVDTNVKPEASADDSPVIPTADVDPPTASGDGKKPTADVVESGEAGELNHAATADESEQATEGAATASAPPGIIEESPETVADAQPTEGGSQVVSEPTPNSTKDPSPESPESLGNEVESLDASGDSTVKSDAAVESSPAAPAADADPTPTVDGGEKPSEDAVVQSDNSGEANLATTAGETEQVAEALDTTSKEPAPASPQVTADSPETVAVIQQTEAEPNVVSEPTTDPAKDSNPPPPEGHVNQADDRGDRCNFKRDVQ
ncbi:hypothetical protein PCASD_24098 [Puccinia coronata f. sp. avenae]|uniref:Uncharacterized protein n=1 Tax=Puccinia coronata f. sp. avenae TaxID=200324 RepID=A0A2N5RX24_9BASI|nr:hypothetical protein PCASD_24098 [Puccinia coronata f. sp. avenae]